MFSAHTQIASMLMLREHMSCLFATIRRFFMTCVDTFSSQHIETAKPRVFTRHALNCACGKNAWFYCACQRKWLPIVIYNESGALTTWQSAFFSWSMWVRVATKAFWKHLWETPSQTCISFCGAAVLAWCEPSLELCLRSVNSKDNGAQSCLAQLQYSNWCVSMCFFETAQRLSAQLSPAVKTNESRLSLQTSSPIFTNESRLSFPWCCVAATMCASTRKMMLRSTDHVCKCKERYHPPPPPHPTPSHDVA